MAQAQTQQRLQSVEAGDIDMNTHEFHVSSSLAKCFAFTSSIAGTARTMTQWSITERRTGICTHQLYIPTTVPIRGQVRRMVCYMLHQRCSAYDLLDIVM